MKNKLQNIFLYLSLDSSYRQTQQLKTNAEIKFFDKQRWAYLFAPPAKRGRFDCQPNGNCVDSENVK